MPRKGLLDWRSSVGNVLPLRVFLHWLAPSAIILWPSARGCPGALRHLVAPLRLGTWQPVGAALGEPSSGSCVARESGRTPARGTLGVRRLTALGFAAWRARWAFVFFPLSSHVARGSFLHDVRSVPASGVVSFVRPGRSEGFVPLAAPRVLLSRRAGVVGCGPLRRVRRSVFRACFGIRLLTPCRSGSGLLDRSRSIGDPLRRRLGAPRLPARPLARAASGREEYRRQQHGE